MYALARSARIVVPRSKPMASARFQSTAFGDFKKNWLSDPGAYPVMAIVTFACGFCTYTGIKNLASNQDVCINPKKRQSVVRI